ncbi:MFS transporter [Nocardioides sp. CER19]|uniref:MFS transporter n=1 Tax=Nocardioides sp. CER19 TaxID=3038538 RepID=UPI00244AA012|nr:MFS transporter [Nocardioides sp. CER19]MDH2416042.1 MFS transporter [Nocardioides sp. CER19]
MLQREGVGYLLGTSFVGRLPTAMSALALVRLVVDGGGSYAFASVLSSAYIVAGMVGQPVLARAVDRTGRRRLVVIAGTVVATLAFVATAVLVDHAAPAVAAVAVAGLATPPIEPTLRSLWASMFSDGAELRSAYGVDAAVQEVGFILGPLVTALGIVVLGADGNVVLMAAIGLVGGLMFAVHPRLRSSGRPSRVQGERHGSPLSSGGFRRILVAIVGAAVPVGSLAVLATAYADSHDHPGLGPWAVALNATGALTGALLVARFPLAATPARALRPLALALAVLYLPLGAWALPAGAWLVAAVLSGLTLPPLLTQVFAQTPLAVRGHHANEANAWVISAFAIGAATGTLLSGFAVQWRDTWGITLAIGVGALVAAACALPAAPRRLVLAEVGDEAQSRA